MKDTTKWKVAILACAVIFLLTAVQLTGSPRRAITLTNDTQVLSEEVEYFENSRGFYAHPVTDGTYPGVIMIHEWWGLNSNIKDTARQLASYGYNVLAVDLYQGNVASTSAEARELSSEINGTTAIANMKAAKAFLREKGSPVFASLGWCFGGGQSLQLALNEEMDATVIYYGSLVTDETELSSIDWPVLGIFGNNDTAIPVESAREFNSTLSRLGVTKEIYIYPDVGHAFANPSGANYASAETQDAWLRTLDFLNKYLRS